MARVLIEEEGRPTRSFRLLTDAVSIGRSDAADLVLPDPDVSRKHALLIREGAGWVVEDQQSANGVSINGASVVRAPFVSGDRLKIGRFTLSFEADDEGDQPEYTDPSGDANNESTVPGIPTADLRAALASQPPPEPPAASAVAAPHLVSHDGDRYDLEGDRVRFGKEVPVSGVLPLGTPGELVAQDGGWALRKTFFLTPVYVNDGAVASQRLRDGDRVRVGSSRFVYHGP